MSDNATCKCGRRWSGTAQCHCSGCHRHFSSIGPFDKHRAGGQCNNPATLRALAAINSVHGPLWTTRDDRPRPKHWRTP